jgi:hypothetical protein
MQQFWAALQLPPNSSGFECARWPAQRTSSAFQYRRTSRALCTLHLQATKKLHDAPRKIPLDLEHAQTCSFACVVMRSR